MNKQKGQMQVLILIGIIIILGIAGVAYYLGRQTLSLRGASETSNVPRGKAGVAILPALSPAPSVSESTGSADMANWKTYTDRTNTFQIKIPFEWHFYTDILNKSTTESISGWVKTNNNFGFEVVSQRMTKINSYDFLIQEVIGAPSGRSIRAYMIKDKTTIAVISAAPTNRNNPDLPPFTPEIHAEFNQILSTFKFIP